MKHRLISLLVAVPLVLGAVSPAVAQAASVPLAKGGGSGSGGHSSGSGGSSSHSGGGSSSGGSSSKGGSTSGSGTKNVTPPKVSVTKPVTGNSNTGSSTKPTTGSTSTGGRAVTPPSNSGGKASVAPLGRNVSAPGNSGGKPVPLSSKIVVTNAPTAKLNIPSTAQARGGTYRSGSTTYHYDEVSYNTYYTSYHGGYPAATAIGYMTLLDSPYYGPNYFNILSPWYHHPYPYGYNYVMTPGYTYGQLVPNAQYASYDTPAGGSSHAWLWIVLFVIVLIAGGVGIFLFVGRKRRTSYGAGI